MDIWFMSDETPVVNGGAGDKVKIKQLEDEISGHESDKRALSTIAARASENETQVSRLQHDLISSMSDAQEANAKISEFEAKDVEKEDKMNAIENERNLLLEKLKESEERFIEFETEKARKIEVLMNKISEFEFEEREKSDLNNLLLDNLKDSEKKEREKADKIDTLMEKLKESESKYTRKIEVLMNKIIDFEEKISLLVDKLTESENKISDLESEAKIKDDKNVVETTTTNNGIVSKVDWPVVAVSAGAIATLGLVYFRHAKF